MKIFFVLVCLPMGTILYIVLNVLIVRWLIGTGREIASATFYFLKRFFRIQFQSLSSMRIWTTATLQFAAIAVLALLLQQPLQLLALASLLLGYVFFVSALTLSLLAQFPYFRKASNDVIVKLCLVALPVFFGFIARGYASSWVGEITGVSASNGGSAVFAATAFLLCLVAAALLALAALLFELSMVVPLIVSDKRRSYKVGLMLLAAGSFVGTYGAAYAAIQLPSSRLGNLLLAAVVYEFDAGPATHCDLSKEERELASGSEPFLKALYLATSQEKALLVKRGPPLFRPVVLRTLKANDATWLLQPLRIAECFKVTVMPLEASKHP